MISAVNWRDIHSRSIRSVQVVSLLVGLGVASLAVAQEEAPRIGLSAERDTYVDQITVLHNTDFTLYAMVFGADAGVPLNQPVSRMPWVIHQVCCGAVLTITDIEFNPILEHLGYPLAGTTTTAPECVDQDSIWLATLTVRLESDQPGDFEWASGPFGAIIDCDGESQFMRGLTVTVSLEETPTPTDLSPWGEVKAMYR